MKLVWDKPTKSFRLLGFLSLSFPFSLSLSFSFSSSSYILYRFPSFFLLQSAPSYWILFPLLPSSYSSISTFLQIFFFFFSLFANSNRGEEKRERKKGEEWHILSSTGSLRFPYPILPSRKMKLLLSPLFLPNLPPSDLPYRLSH